MAFFEEVVQAFGVPKSVGQIYGLLFSSPTPLCFSDIVDRLDISKGSVSQGLQLLRSLRAINVAPTGNRSFDFWSLSSGLEGARRDFYTPELSLRRLMNGVLQEQVKPLVAGSVRLARLRELAEEDKNAKEFCLDQVRQLETWRRRFRTVLPVLTALLGPKAKS